MTAIWPACRLDRHDPQSVNDIEDIVHGVLGNCCTDDSAKGVRTIEFHSYIAKPFSKVLNLI